MCDTARRGHPLFSIESCAPLAEFDAVGITLPHELALRTCLRRSIWQASRCMRTSARERPLVVGAPAPVQPRALRAVLRRVQHRRREEALPRPGRRPPPARRGAARADILRALADEPGWYVRRCTAGVPRTRRRKRARGSSLWERAPLRIEEPVRGLRGKPWLGAVHRAVHRGGASAERRDPARVRPRAASARRA
ncbi:MAG: hypothetical protein ACLTMP_10750 [Eggerthella lenta]